METVYMICAAVGGTLIVCQFLATLLGLGGHHDLGHDAGGHDMGGHDVHDGDHHDGSHGTDSNWFFSMLTFRTLSAAFAFFGLSGLASIRLQMDDVTGLVLAVLAGSIALFIVAWLMRQISKLNVDGTIHIERAVGSHGTVYLSIPEANSGVGKVHVNLLDRTVEYKAITSHDPLPTGAKIVVVRVVNADTVEVEPEVKSQESKV